MGLDSGRRYAATWVESLDRLSDQLRAATDAQVEAQLAEKRHQEAFLRLKDELDEAEIAWDSAAREREEADNDVQSIIAEMLAIEKKATVEMQLGPPRAVEDREALEEEEAERLEEDRRAGAARLALSPIELHAKFREARIRAVTGVAA